MDSCDFILIETRDGLITLCFIIECISGFFAAAGNVAGHLAVAGGLVGVAYLLVQIGEPVAQTLVFLVNA